MDKEQLKKLILSSEEKLNQLKGIDYDNLKGKILELESIFKEFKEGGESLLTDSDVLQIGIVGQVKAGKSSFLNSLFFNGEDVLPKASTPMTAGLTIIEYADKNTFEVEYFNEDDWSIFVDQYEEYNKRESEVRSKSQGVPESIIKKEIEARTTEKIRSAHEMVSACTSKAKSKIGCNKDSKAFTDIDDLQDVLEQYVGANGEYTSVVKSLYIKMNDERLQGLRIVDTPGVNDPVVSRENRTRTFLHSCHGVFLLSASTDFLGSGDVNFLNTRIGGSGIGSVVLLASKFDSVLQDLGADKEMKGESRCDLVDEVEKQTKKFKKRYRELSDTIDEKLRDKIKIDTTAGIGYSIAHKQPSRWDDVEKQVVKQMQRYYPDYFDTEANIKETFEGLANIADIKEKYLDGVFMSNKETIISERIKEFFVANKKEISSTLERILSEYKVRKEQLNESTIEEIKRQKELQSKLFSQLQTTFSGIFSSFQRSLQTEVKHIGNSVPFNEIRNIPVEETNQSFSVLGFLDIHKNKNISYEQVNSYLLQTQIGESIDNYVKGWNNAWQDLFLKTRDELSDKLNKAISDFEVKVMSTCFKDIYYRNLIDKALDELRDNKELKIDSIIMRYKRQGDDIANDQYSPRPKETENLKKDEVSSYLKSKFRDHKEDLIKRCRNLADGIKVDVENEVKKNMSGAMSTIDEMKSNFADNLKEEGEAYLAGLEKDMLEKTAVLEKVDNIIKCITELSNLYN